MSGERKRSRAAPEASASPGPDDEPARKHAASLAQWRERDFEHVDGNWPTFVYAEICAPEAAVRAAERWLARRAEAAGAVAGSSEEDSGASGAAATPATPEAAVERIERPHLTLSRTFPLRGHQVEAFAAEVGTNVRAVPAFPALFSGLRLFESESGSRTFASAQLRRGARSFRELVQQVDAAAAAFSKPTYFADPEGHVSLCWAPSALQPTLPAASSEADTPGSVRFEAEVAEIVVQSGNRKFIHALPAR